MYADSKMWSKLIVTYRLYLRGGGLWAELALNALTFVHINL